MYSHFVFEKWQDLYRRFNKMKQLKAQLRHVLFIFTVRFFLCVCAETFSLKGLKNLAHVTRIAWKRAKVK